MKNLDMNETTETEEIVELNGEATLPSLILSPESEAEQADADEPSTDDILSLAPVEKEFEVISSADKKHVEAIRNYKAHVVANTAQAHKVSKHLKLSKKNEFLTMACEDTGIISILEIPSIPGKALTYKHPLSELPNARGIAQQGVDYLRKLDTQVLAGILITLANDYNLFHYQPSDSGAQKNAILRTSGSQTLINAILTIEDMIHSGNSMYLPRLSLLLDTELSQAGIQIRMEHWLSLVVQAIYTPDTVEYDVNRTVQSERKQERRAKFKAESALTLRQKAKEKQFAKDLKQSQNLIKDLHKAEKISVKFRSFLAQIFTPFTILNMEDSAKALLINKLSDIDTGAAAQLVAILKTDRSGIECDTAPLDDFFGEVTEISQKATVIKPSGTRIAVEILSIEVPSVQKEETNADTSTAPSDGTIIMPANLSFVERIKWLRANKKAGE